MDKFFKPPLFVGGRSKNFVDNIQYYVFGCLLPLGLCSYYLRIEITNINYCKGVDER